MQILSIHAFTVIPRPREGAPAAVGGRISLSPALRKLLVEAYNASDFGNRSDADFNMEADRNHQVRSLIMGYSFGDRATQDASAETLADALSSAKDQRSKPDLLLIASFGFDEERGLAVWTFPQDQAIRLGDVDKKPSIEILEEVFSRTSRLRKAAWYKGRNSRTAFLRGKVLDFQSGRGDEPSKLWVDRFLGSRLAVTPTVATREVAKTLRAMSTSAATEAEQKAVVLASGALASAARQEWSFSDIADTYFEGRQRRTFLSKVPAGMSVDTRFEIDRTTWEKKVGKVSFDLATGAIVLTPPNQIDESIKLVENDGETILYCEGRVVSQRVKGRTAG